MNHNKIYVYSNDTQRNVSMRHAATISLLNLYPKVLGTFLASCRRLRIGREASRIAKTKESRRIFQHWHTNVESIPRIRSETITHWLHSLLHNWRKPRGFAFGPFAAHTSYTSCKSAPLPFKQSSPPFFFRATYNNRVVPTTWENTRELAYRLRSCLLNYTKSTLEMRNYWQFGNERACI